MTAPWAPTPTPTASRSPSSAASPRPSTSACSTPPARGPAPARAAGGLRLDRARRRARATGSATATACHGPGAAATRPSCCSTRTRARSPASVTWHPAVTADDDRRLRAVRPALGRPCATGSTGATTAPGHGARRLGHLRAAREGLHEAAPRRPRGAAWHVSPGSAHPAAIEHLLELGVTAVELLPVHQFVHDRALAARGLRNYWGYQSIGFFAPHNEYAAGDGGSRSRSSRRWSSALHAAGLEVILDVVFNHTAEGGERRADAVLPRPRRRRLLPAATTTAATSTTRAAATRSTRTGRRRCGS